MVMCVTCPKEINYIVFVLVAIFAISSWIDINGLWVELPILVQNLPEQWNLPSYMAIIIQIANIGPLTFTISTYIWPRKVKEIPVIYVIISVGAISCLLLVFFWDSVTLIGGVHHSTALLVLQFFLAIVDCTSSVAFYPFMALLKPQYMTALFIGESLSGLLPSLVALGQGAGQMTCVNVTSWTNITIDDNTTSSTNISQHSVIPVYEQPKFSIEIFFYFLFGMLILSGIAFSLLNYLPYCRSEFLSETDSIGTSSDLLDGEYMSVPCGSNNSYELSESSTEKFLDAAGEQSSTSLLKRSRPNELTIHTQDEIKVEIEDIHRPINKPRFILLSILTMWINALSNGVLPSIQSYSCLPYGNRPYHLAVTLSSMTGPIACFTLLFLQVKNMSKLVVLTICGTLLASYVMAMAVLSPSPLLIGTQAGTSLIILSWILTTYFLTYSKVCVASEFRIGGRKALLWCGVFTQVGSAVGALIMFILINQLHYFKTGTPCL